MEVTKSYASVGKQQQARLDVKRKMGRKSKKLHQEAAESLSLTSARSSMG